MVARQASHPASAAAGGHHTNTTTTTNTSTPASSSSIKPTGWIRSTSASKPSSSGGVLTDRTNLPSGTSRHTPSRSLSKLSAPTSVQALSRRTLITGGKAADRKQQKLSSFFATNTAPPVAAARATAVGEFKRAQSTLYQDSPSLDRAHRAKKSNGISERNEAGPSRLAVFEDQDLDARAANLLRGRFGSVSRSLNPSRSSTPTRPVSPPLSDPDPPRQHVQSALASPPPQRPRSRQPVQAQRKNPAPTAQITPPRPKRVEPPPPPQPPSSPPAYQTLLQESLSNFTPLPWEKARGSNMALFQRLAGLPPEDVRECEKRRMQEELAKAHRRLQGRSPSASRSAAGVEMKSMAPPSKKQASPTASRMKRAAALTSSPTRTRTTRDLDVGPRAMLRSPRTNRRIYALETQLAGAPGVRAVSVQPSELANTGDGGQARRAASEAQCNGESTSRHNSKLSSAMQREDKESETQPLPWGAEEESETLPLPWPAEEEDHPIAQAEFVDAGVVQETPGQETQLLAWDDGEDEGGDEAEAEAGPTDRLDALRKGANPPAHKEVPPSDDEDVLLELPIEPSSSPSPSPSASPVRTRSTSPTPSSLHPQSPIRKRRKIGPTPVNSSPTLSRDRLSLSTPVQPQRLAKVSPITLNPSTGGTNHKFDSVVAALKKEERRQNSGMQLSLNGFISSDRRKGKEEGQMEQRREGLSEDLMDVLSDDDEENADETVSYVRPQAQGVELGEEDETQPLAWPSSSPLRPQAHIQRPAPLPVQRSPDKALNSSQRTTASTSSSSSSGVISVPSQSNLHEAGNTQLRSFFEHL